MSYRTEKEERVALALDRLHGVRQDLVAILMEYYTITTQYLPTTSRFLTNVDKETVEGIMSDVEKYQGLLSAANEALAEAMYE